MLCVSFPTASEITHSQKPMNFITDPQSQEHPRATLFDSLCKTTQDSPKDKGLLCLASCQMAQACPVSDYGVHHPHGTRITTQENCSRSVKTALLTSEVCRYSKQPEQNTRAATRSQGAVHGHCLANVFQWVWISHILPGWQGLSEPDDLCGEELCRSGFFKNAVSPPQHTQL